MQFTYKRYKRAASQQQTEPVKQTKGINQYNKPNPEAAVALTYSSCIRGYIIPPTRTTYKLSRRVDMVPDTR